MLENITLRHKISQAARRYLDRHEFLEIETPILTKSTPEGARDFLVPSRLSPGEFYALPQSPQIFKQILMVSGMERYFQFARAFRDEDLRSDRQPEHTQIDIEMSFVTEADVHRMVEGMFQAVFREALGQTLDVPFIGLDYHEAMMRYGSDKPDLRYDLEIADTTKLWKSAEFKVFGETVRQDGSVLAMTIAAPEMSRSELDRLTELVKTHGAKGLPWIRWGTGLAPESPIAKFLKPDELEGLKTAARVKVGDVTFFGVGKPLEAAAHLGALRKELIAKLGLKPSKPWAFLWVTHFPLLEWDAEEKHWTFTHNPFTAPLDEEIPKLDSDPGAVRSHQYDLVLNGTELASGSIRNHRVDLQEKIFGLMGYDRETQRRRFALLLNALDYGAPPHGGIGIGLDRLTAILRGEDSIREVIASISPQNPERQAGADGLAGLSFYFPW
jgi:aspartyl-tRNA synthetase